MTFYGDLKPNLLDFSQISTEKVTSMCLLERVYLYEGLWYIDLKVFY